MIESFPVPVRTMPAVDAGTANDGIDEGSGDYRQADIWPDSGAEHNTDQENRENGNGDLGGWMDAAARPPDGLPLLRVRLADTNHGFLRLGVSLRRDFLKVRGSTLVFNLSAPGALWRGWLLCGIDFSLSADPGRSVVLSRGDEGFQLGLQARQDIVVGEGPE